MKKYNWIITTFSLAGFIVGIFFLCQPNSQYMCKGNSYWSTPLWASSMFLFILSLLLFFVREEIFRLWFRFAKWYALISFFLVLITPTTTGHGGFNPLPSDPDKGTVTLLLSVFFFLISLIIIAYKLIRLKTVQKRG